MIPEQAFAELRAVYDRLGVALAPYQRSCAARGICCDFAKSGHMLYVTGLEAAEMLHSGANVDREMIEQGSCPFLRGKQCGIRDHRALGCRLYYCDRTYEEERNALCEASLKEVRAIEAKYGMEHSYKPVIEAFDLGSASRVQNHQTTAEAGGS